jgi:hypothetical protein
MRAVMPHGHYTAGPTEGVAPRGAAEAHYTYGRNPILTMGHFSIAAGRCNSQHFNALVPKVRAHDLLRKPDAHEFLLERRQGLPEGLQRLIRGEFLGELHL